MAANEAAAEREQDEALLADLIDQAGELNAQKSAIESTYNDRRRRVDALMRKLGLVEVSGRSGAYDATLKRGTERYIDPYDLDKALRNKGRYRECVTVTLSAAEQHLAPADFGNLVRTREKAEPTLRILKTKD